MKVKPFEEVQIGDIATDYGNMEYPVIGKGTLKELFNKFADRCAMGLEDCTSDEGIWSEDDLGIACEVEPQFDGDVVIYLYSLDGAAVLI